MHLNVKTRVLIGCVILGFGVVAAFSGKIRSCRPNDFNDRCLVSFIENYLSTTAPGRTNEDIQLRADLKRDLEMYHAPNVPESLGETGATSSLGKSWPPPPFHGLLKNAVDTGEYKTAIAEIRSLNAIPLEERELPKCTAECFGCQLPRFDSVHEDEFKRLHGHISDEDLLDLAYEANGARVDSITDVATIIARDKGASYLSKLTIKSCTSSQSLQECLSTKISKDASDLGLRFETACGPQAGVKAEYYLAILDSALGKPGEASDQLQKLNLNNLHNSAVEKTLITSLFQTNCDSQSLHQSYQLGGLLDLKAEGTITTEKFPLTNWQTLEAMCMAEKGNYLEKLKNISDSELRTNYAVALGSMLREKNHNPPINVSPIDLLPFANLAGRNEIYQHVFWQWDAKVDDKTKVAIKAKLLETEKYFGPGEYEQIILPYIRMMSMVDLARAESIWETHTELHNEDLLATEVFQLFATEKHYDSALRAFRVLPAERRRHLASSVLYGIPPEFLKVDADDLPESPTEKAKLYGLILRNKYVQNWVRLSVRERQSSAHGDPLEH